MESLYRAALSAAATDLETLGPHAIARPHSNGGWVLETHHPTPTTDAHVHAHITPMADGAFPGATAGARLIEHGWIIHPAAHYADDRTVTGWLDHGDGLHTAPITRTHG